jgi:hypothetical protein
MSINPAKYLKLSTQPWTGNIITDPTDSLTITDLNGGSVTLTEEDGDLLINGQPIPTSGGTGGVTSITAVPGSGITVTPPSGTGAVSLSYASSSGGVQTITAGANIEVEQVGSEATVSLNATQFVSSITPGSFEFWLRNGIGRGDVELNSFASARIPVYTMDIYNNNGNLTTDTFDCATFDPGVYFVEVNFTQNVFNVQLSRYNCTFVLLKRTTGLVSCGGTHSPTIDPDGAVDDFVRVYNAAPYSPSQVITVNTQVQLFHLDLLANLAVFRIV